jgi:capsular polysaccharide export protein
MTTGAGRRVLLLQGPSNDFFALLGDALAARGAQAFHLALCPGDALMRRGRRARWWRGAPDEWPAWIAAHLAAEGITDLVLLGDHRPRHGPAMIAARAGGVRVHHAELGLLRPGRLSLEPDGPGAWFPRSADGIRRLAARARGAGGPDGPCAAAPAGFAAYAGMDVAWNMANVLAAWALFPGHERHQLWHPLAEYAGWAWKAARAGRDRRQGAALLAAWRLDRADAPRAPVFVLLVQLRGDAQIRARGPDADLRVTLRRVVADFSANAPPDARLLIKTHPMDNALTPWRRIAKRATGAAADRAEVVDRVPLAPLIARAAGVVTVNSGAGLEALAAGRPVKALGRAVWDVPGLCHPGPLAGFWHDPAPPDMALVADMLIALDWACHVPGAFDGPAAREGASAMAARILAPPRLMPPRGAGCGPRGGRPPIGPPPS